jgi:signal transduction histidine kinase
MPLAMVLAPGGGQVVVLLNGWREQGIQVIDRRTGKVTQTLLQPAAFLGIAFAPDGRALYASGGNQDMVYRYDWAGGGATLTDAAQNAAYFVVAEALTNMEKHSVASRCSVEIHQVGGVVVIAVTDDGVGGASLSRGHGLAGLADRLAGVDGTLTVTSPTGGPTQVTATIPALAS